MNMTSPLTGRGRLVDPDPADQARVPPRGVERGRHVHQLDPGRPRQQSGGLLRAEVVGELGVYRQRVAGEDRNADTGAGDQQVRDVQDLPGLVTQLLLLVGLTGAVVDDRPGQRQDVVGTVLR